MSPASLNLVKTKKCGKAQIIFTYVCGHGKMFPVEDVQWKVTANHGEKKKKKHSVNGWWCGACGACGVPYCWRKPNRLLTLQIGDTVLVAFSPASRNQVKTKRRAGVVAEKKQVAVWAAREAADKAVENLRQRLAELTERIHADADAHMTEDQWGFGEWHEAGGSWSGWQLVGSAGRWCAGPAQ